MSAIKKSFEEDEYAQVSAGALAVTGAGVVGAKTSLAIVLQLY